MARSAGGVADWRVGRAGARWRVGRLAMVGECCAFPGLKVRIRGTRSFEEEIEMWATGPSISSLCEVPTASDMSQKLLSFSESTAGPRAFP